MEIHHIVYRNKGGEDTEENGIPLCFDCHAEVGAYDPQHPKGRRFTESELRSHKQQWFRIVSLAPWHWGGLGINVSLATLGDINVERIVEEIKTRELSDPTARDEVQAKVQRLGHELRKSLLHSLRSILQTEPNEMTRQNAGYVVEFLVQWDPGDVPIELLTSMASDAFHSVRSSAAVAFCHLARMAPARVPLDELARLATPTEDWYVVKPATTALLYLARTRGVAVEILASSIGISDTMNDHLAEAFQRLVKVAPNALRDDIAHRMIKSGHAGLCSVGAEWMARIDASDESRVQLDHYIF